MPSAFAVEDLFDEFEGILEDCVQKIFEDNYTLRENVIMKLSRAAGRARKAVNDIHNMDEAKALLRNEQDVKDIFWAKVKASDYKLAQDKVAALKTLINATQ